MRGASHFQGNVTPKAHANAALVVIANHVGNPKCNTGKFKLHSQAWCDLINWLNQLMEGPYRNVT